MFKRKPLYRNGLDELIRAKEESSGLRSIATRTLIRSLEALARERAEKEAQEQIERFRDSGAL